jgi:hypothetical protein
MKGTCARRRSWKTPQEDLHILGVVRAFLGIPLYAGGGRPISDERGLVKLDFKTALIVVLLAVSISTVAFALNTYYNSSSFVVRVQPAPGVNSTTVSVTPSLGVVLASAGGNYPEAVCFTNRAVTSVTVSFNYSVQPPPGGAFSDVVWQLLGSINLPAGQNSCSSGYPIVVAPTAASDDYNVSVTHSWSG